MRRYLAACLATACIFALAAPSRADLVTVIYEAQALTVAKKPFGLTIPLNTPVNGYFTFDTDALDSAPDNELRGGYQHDGNAAFSAEFLTTRITGSSTPYYEVFLISDPTVDTFRIYDGPRPVGHEGGIMSINGVADEDIELFLAVTEDVFDSDALINPFPFYTFGFLGTPHTFALEDEQGTMLLKMNKTREAVCGDPGGGGVAAGDALTVLRTSVGSQQCLPCLCDVDANGSISIADAQKTLRFAVSGVPALHCSACL